MRESAGGKSGVGPALWWVGLALAFALMLLVNPSGFIGGGQDDWHYLQAARCLREHGLCLPQDHWEARWPVTVPIAVLTSLLGESRFSVSIAPGVASMCALVLFALIGNRMFGRPVGWMSALLLLLTPAFSGQLTQPSVEATELCFIFAGFFAALKWQAVPRLHWAFIAGLLFALAIQVRETAFIAAPFAFGYLWFGKPRPRFADLIVAATGFAIPFVVEFAWFAASTGDPFYRLKLSMAHTRIWSSELLGPIDRRQPPFFNPAYIANWRMDPGVHVHWTVDGLLNLLVNALAGVSFPIVTLALIFGRGKLGAATSRRLLILWLVAVAWMACLIYAFAIDPKPRMMLAPLSMLNVALALVTLRLVTVGSQLVAYALWLASAIVGLTLHYAHQRTYFIERAARAWIEARPGEIEMEQTSRYYLALVPSAEALPEIDSNRRFLLLSSSEPCTNWAEKSGLPSGSLRVVASQKNTAITLPSIGGALCLFEYARPIPPPVLADAIQRVRLEHRGKILRQHQR